MLDLLIIGKNGQLATELIDISKKKKINFKALSRKELDVTNHNLISVKIKKLKPKAIINTSAYHVLSDCENYPLKAFEVNSVAVGNLAKISKEVGAKLVTISTNYVFDGEKKSRYKEDDKVNPLQIYGLSKLAGEFDSLSKYPDGTYVIRTCGLYGNGKLGSRDKRGNFILKVIQEAQSHGIVKSSAIEFVNPTYAKDLSNAIVKLLYSKASSGVYHLVNEGITNWFDFTKMILEYKAIKANVIASNENTGFYRKPLFSAIANTKAKKLGIILPKIQDGLKRYLDEI